MGQIMKWLLPKFARLTLLTTIAASAGWSTLTPTLAQDAYLCVAEGVAGIAYYEQTKQWSATIFSPSGKKHIIRRAKDGERSLGPLGGDEFKWGLFNFGSAIPTTICRDDFSESGTIFCQSLTTLFFSRKTLRYQTTYQIGYVNPDISGKDKEGGDTPHIEFGKCSPL